MLILSPLEQFSLSTLLQLNFLGYNISITNATLFLVLSFSILYLMLTLATRESTVVPNNWQYVAEGLYNFVNESLVRDLIQGGKGREYFPFIFVLFTFILTRNELGMIPYTFTVTSHLFITFRASWARPSPASLYKLNDGTPISNKSLTSLSCFAIATILQSSLLA